MNGRGFFRGLAIVALVVIVAGIGIGLYQAGVSSGAADAAVRAAASGGPATIVPGYGYGYWHGFGWGFHPFGFIFWILGIVLIIALVRGAFGGGRRWGGPGRHGGHEDREDRLAAWHRAAHDEPPATGS